MNYDLSLSNGQKIVSLPLHAYSVQSREEAIKLVERLVIILEQMKAAMVYADDMYQALDKECKANEKARSEEVTPV